MFPSRINKLTVRDAVNQIEIFTRAKDKIESNLTLSPFVCVNVHQSFYWIIKDEPYATSFTRWFLNYNFPTEKKHTEFYENSLKLNKKDDEFPWFNPSDRNIRILFINKILDLLWKIYFLKIIEDVRYNWVNEKKKDLDHRRGFYICKEISKALSKYYNETDFFDFWINFEKRIVDWFEKQHPSINKDNSFFAEHRTFLKNSNLVLDSEWWDDYFMKESFNQRGKFLQFLIKKLKKEIQDGKASY